ncbi:MAG TPA: chorismate mutase [Planctomycetota bacterium]|nr:chorismate mutase [Planctomycetota bacterium]
MAVRGIRGAVNIASNTKEEILTKSRELLEAILSANKVKPGDIAAAIFTLSPDLNADFPAYAARQLGWTDVPLMCARELDVPGAMEKVIRVLLLVNSRIPAGKIRHQYLGDTPRLRPDLAQKGPKGDR